MIPQFTTKEEAFEYIRQNKDLIMKDKRSQIKHADGIGCVFVDYDESKNIATKAAGSLAILDTDKYKISAVINACGLLDTHGDVHIPGLWKKTVKETKSGLHLQEHVMRFDHVISKDVKVYTAIISWKDLGFNYPGTTEILINEVIAEKKRNPFMAEQYANGWVDQHSVGMYYVNYFLCLNSENKYDKEEKANWDKYYPMVVNKDVADAYGFFFAVTEAKYVEGSAVVMGSNVATPTQSVEPIQPPEGTEKSIIEPVVKSLDYNAIAQAIQNSFNH